MVDGYDFGTAMHFDPTFYQAAIHDYSLINPDLDYLDGMTEVTVMMWIKSSLIDTDRGYIIFEEPANNDDRDMRYDTVGATAGGDDVQKIGVMGPGRQQIESSEYSQIKDEWQHVAMTWKSGEFMKFYINSVENTPTDIEDQENGALDGYSKIIVGRGGKDEAGAFSGRPGWHGLVDDVKIFARALTQAQIQQEAHITDSNPVITAFPSNQTLVQETDGATLALDVTITDLLGDYQVTWTQLSGPGTILPEDYSPAQPLAQGTEDVTIDFSGLPWGMYHIGFEVQDAESGSPDDTDDLYVFWQEKVQYSTNKDTPMALWKLDAVSGTLVEDDTAYNLDGQTVNDPNWVAGKIANSLKFYNGAAIEDNQHVDLSSVPSTDNLTVMFWMKAAATGNMVPIDKLPDDDSGAGWNIKLRSDGAVWLQIGSEDTNHTFVESPAGAYAVDTWVHVAATFDDASDTGKLFIGGLKVAEETGITQTLRNFFPPMQMGQPNDAQTGEKYRGQLDQVRLYDIVLSEFEIAQIALEDQVVIEEGCQLDRWPAEQTIEGDISGPVRGPNNEPIPDCYVDLFDVAELAGDWLKCRDLNQPSCWP